MTPHCWLRDIKCFAFKFHRRWKPRKKSELPQKEFHIDVSAYKVTKHMTYSEKFMWIWLNLQWCIPMVSAASGGQRLYCNNIYVEKLCLWEGWETLTYMIKYRQTVFVLNKPLSFAHRMRRTPIWHTSLLATLIKGLHLRKRWVTWNTFHFSAVVFYFNRSMD